LSDDELILRYIAPAGEVLAMHEAGPPRMYETTGGASIAHLIRELLSRGEYRQISVQVRNGSLHFHSRTESKAQ
jgi:Na+-transporting NADH:ubiquinone oxidoreductase subunit NqrA